MVIVYMITGIGVWLCAAVLMTITFIEQRAVVRGRRPGGTWLARDLAKLRSMERFTWIFLVIPIVSIAARSTAAGHFIYLPIHVWGIVGLWMPLRLAFVYMASAARWASNFY
jgi:hypothetical protein